MDLKIYDSYKGGHNSIALDPKSLNNALKEPLWMKETDSLSIIRGHIQGFKKPHVATSWGKDSTVMSHMVVHVCKELDIKPTNGKFPMFVLNHTRNIYAEELEYWKKITSFLEIPKEKFLITYPRGSKTVWSIAEDVGYIPMFRRASGQKKKYIPYEYRKEPTCCEELKKEPVNDYLKSLPEDLRFDCSFVGTKAVDSLPRRLNILMHCRTYETDYQRPYKIRTVQPIAFLTDENIDEYLIENSIPENPAYKIHNQKRLGCASCPAHKNWEIRQARDPTPVGQGMLLQNMRILYASQIKRLWNTIYILRTSDELTVSERERAEKIIQRVLSEKPLQGWKQASWDDDLLPEAEKMMIAWNNRLELFCN